MPSFYPTFQTITGKLAGSNDPSKSYTISQMYCLSEDSAKALAAILTVQGFTVEIVEGPPVPNIGRRFQLSGTVPFFQFPDGKVRNAGVLATYWDWFSAPTALQACIDDINDPYMGTELLA